MRAALATLALLAATSALAQDRNAGLVPDEMGEAMWIDLVEFDEPPIFLPAHLGSNQARYRMTISGINCHEYVFRIDHRRRGPVEGTVKMRNKCGNASSRGYTEAHFRASEAELAQLVSTMADQRMFEIYPQYWSFADDEIICVDGNELVFERLDADGYRYSSANAQCGAPSGMLRAALQVIDMADVEDARALVQ